MPTVDYLSVDRKLERTAAALFVVYVFLLALLLASYIRVVWTIRSDPGLVPCGIGGGPNEKEKLEVDSDRNVDHNGKEREKRRPYDNHEQDALQEGVPRPSRGRDRCFANIHRSSHSRAGEDAGDDIPQESGGVLHVVPYASTVSRSSRMESRTPSPLPPESAPQLAHPLKLTSIAIHRQQIYKMGYLKCPCLWGLNSTQASTQYQDRNLLHNGCYQKTFTSFTIWTRSSARMTGYQDGVFIVTAGSLTEVTTVGSWEGV
ncbi:hypothetical protein BGX38DRAFT_1265773 [Terfezia claveryi]|nr:hypothetical protein BGX38DRAFT_1265773 [Terfezia claveryi]